MATITSPNYQKKTVIVPFMKDEAAKRNVSALKVPSQYNDGTGKFEPLAPTSNALVHGTGVVKYLVGQEDLRQALIQYKTLKAEPFLNLDVDKCSWQDVFAQMESARATDERRSAGWKGSIRKLWGKMGEKAEMTLPALDAIPDQFGLSIVRAGLALCFLVKSTLCMHQRRNNLAKVVCKEIC